MWSVAKPPRSIFFPSEAGVFQSWGIQNKNNGRGHQDTASSTKTATLLDEGQGCSAMAIGAFIISLQTGFSVTTLARATKTLEWVRTNYVDKWQSRNNGYADSYSYNQLPNGHADAAGHWAMINMVMALQYPNDGRPHAERFARQGADLMAMQIDSVAAYGRTPAKGARRGKAYADTSHAKRWPTFMLWQWLLNQTPNAKAELHGMALHFESMLWNGVATNPKFSHYHVGGANWGGAYSFIGVGWIFASAASNGANRGALEAIMTNPDGIPANPSLYAGGNFRAWNMATKAIANSL